MFYFNKNMFKSGYVLLTFAIILIPLSFVLPIECSYENHLLENLEITVLFTGIILSIYKIVHTNKFNKFYISCSIFYFVMILRELSWGRVFYPIGLKNNGEEIYMSIHDIWYGPYCLSFNNIIDYTSHHITNKMLCILPSQKYHLAHSYKLFNNFCCFNDYKSIHF